MAELKSAFGRTGVEFALALQDTESAAPMQPYVPLTWHLPLAVSGVVCGLALTARFCMCASGSADAAYAIAEPGHCSFTTDAGSTTRIDK